MTKVSVLMPCYNAERYIRDSIESILRQTHRDLELIVVNDGSTDRSADIAAEYESSGVKLITQNNRGQCAAANQAFNASSGELVKFFDADDILSPDHVALQVARLEGCRDAIAMGEWARFRGDDSEAARFGPLSMYRDADPVDWLASEWMNARPMMQCGLWLIPRAIVECSGLWNESLSLLNDFEYFARVLLNASEILYTPGARLYYRSGIAGSLSGAKTRKAVESEFISLLLGTGHLLAVEDSVRTRRACANMLLNFDYTFYPEHADLRAKARARVAELGGADLEPDGPPGFHHLRLLIGWRAARLIQRLRDLVRIGLTNAPRNRRGYSGQHSSMPTAGSDEAP